MRSGSERMELPIAMKSRTGCMIIALLLCGAAPALAQTTPSTPKHEPLQKTIGQQLWLEHLLSYEKYPPLQAPESYNLSGILEQVKKANASHGSD